MDFLNGINALTLVFASLLIFAMAYRFYGILMAQRVLRMNGANPTPAVSLAVLAMLLMALVFVRAFRKWARLLGK